MPSPTKRPSSRRQPRQAHALLPHLPVLHTTTAVLFPLHTRHLQLRGNVLLLSRTPLTHALPPSLTTLALSPSTHLRLHTSTRLTIGPHRLTFRTAHAQAAFLVAVRPHLCPRPRFHPHRLIGRGASASVYLATVAARRVAVKAIPNHDAFASSRSLQRLLTERRVLAENRSPFLARLRAAFDTPTHLCLVTDLAELGDLHAVLSASPRHRFSPDVARLLFAEIVLGLRHLHNIGFLYRDLKLANLLLSASGHVRLSDFGLAKAVSEDVTFVPSPSLSESSSVSSSSSDSEEDASFSSPKPSAARPLGRATSFVGTRRYMSPEHLRTGGANKPRGYGTPADVWALGVALYVMLYGRYPFGDSSPSSSSHSLFMAIRHDELRFPADDDVPAEARGLLAALLERDPLERLDLDGVMNHPWMRGVDFERLASMAAADEPLEQVVDFVGDNVKPLDERMKTGPKVSIDGLLSELSDDDRAKKRGKIGRHCKKELRLLGFNYVSPHTE